MLQKLKNKLRFLKNKWSNLKGIKKFWIVSILLCIVIGGAGTSFNLHPVRKPYIYTEMKNVIDKMVAEKNTDVEYDASKIGTYIVTHKSNGDKEIRLGGNSIIFNLEEMNITLSNDYQIKLLSKSPAVFLLIMSWIAYILLSWALGCVLIGILLGIYKLSKKTVLFF